MGALARVISRSTSLTHLDLASNGLGMLAVGRLGPVLEQGVLRSLNLSNNEIPAAAGAMLAEGLEHCSLLTHLKLSDNKLGAQGVGVVARVLPHCQCLDVAGNMIGPAGKLGEARDCQADRALTMMIQCVDIHSILELK